MFVQHSCYLNDSAGNLLKLLNMMQGSAGPIGPRGLKGARGVKVYKDIVFWVIVLVKRKTLTPLFRVRRV